MFDGKFLCTLAVLVATVIAICNFTPGRGSEVIEGLGMLPSMVPRVAKIARQRGSGNTQAIQNQHNSMYTPRAGLAGMVSQAPGISSTPEFFQVPGTFQSNLSPRFANTNFGANIRYNAPAYKNMGVPKTPLGYANAARENYTENYGCAGCNSPGCFSATCGKGGASPKACGVTPSPPVMAAGYANGDFNHVTRKTSNSNPSNMGMTDTLPVGDMTTLNNMGEKIDNVIVYDRFMFANRNSTLRGQGDWIRGDLPIQPCNTGWFQVSVTPSIDLNQGAMNVLGGINNETNNALANMLNSETGTTTISGVNMTTQELASVGAMGNDINITAFP